jgi:predicted esterase
VTIDDYEELVEGLVTAGADVELHWYDTGHEICDQELDDAREWLRKRLA